METKGGGKFYFPEFKKEFESQFIIDQKISEESMIFVELRVNEEFSKFLMEKHNEKETRLRCSINGELESGMNIQVEEAYFIGANIKNFMATLKFKIFSNVIIGKRGFKDSKDDEEIHFLITNLEFVGTERTVSQKGGWRLDRSRITVGNYELIFKQFDDYDKLIKALKKEFKDTGAFTTEIIIKTSLKNHEEVKGIVENVCYLLSFARGVDIIPSKSFHLREGEKVWGEATNIGKRPFRAGDYLIHHLPPEGLFDFIEEVYPNYIKYKDNIGLPVLFNLYTAMKSAFYMELRCLIGYVILETLGENLQGFYQEREDPIESSLKLKPKKLKKILPKEHNLSKDNINDICSKLSYNNPSLQDSIERIKRDFKFLYRTEDKKLFEYRKYFVHKGRFPEGINKVQTYQEIISLIDRLLLSILKYTGDYCDVSRGYKTEKIEYEKLIKLKKNSK